MEVFETGIYLVNVILIGVITMILFDWFKTLAWKAKYNIKGGFPLPVIGNLLDAFMRTQDENDRIAYETYGPVTGGVIGSVKVMHVADINILKKLMVKDHLKFQNRFSFRDIDPEPINFNLLSLKDSHWKRVRNIVTPSYSPGKIKQMLGEMKYAAELLVSSLHEKAESGEAVESKLHFGCYSMDVIAGTAFGIRTDAYRNPEQPFISLARTVLGQDHMRNPFFIIAFLFPRLAFFLSKYLKITIMYPVNAVRFFTKVIMDIIKDRKENQDSNRNDLLQLMLNDWAEDETVENITTKKVTTDELLAQGFLVFIAGYETTASLLTFMSYVLATHPDIQEKLIEEIDAYIKSDDDVSYDRVMEMSYLDQVVCETLRMYPPVSRMNRMTSNDQDVEIDGYTFTKDTMITYSVWQIHHQLGFYSEPETFIPESYIAAAGAPNNGFLVFLSPIQPPHHFLASSCYLTSVYGYLPICERQTSERIFATTGEFADSRSFLCDDKESCESWGYCTIDFINQQNQSTESTGQLLLRLASEKQKINGLTDIHDEINICSSTSELGV